MQNADVTTLQCKPIHKNLEKREGLDYHTNIVSDLIPKAHCFIWVLSDLVFHMLEERSLNQENGPSKLKAAATMTRVAPGTLHNRTRQPRDKLSNQIQRSRSGETELTQAPRISLQAPQNVATFIQQVRFLLDRRAGTKREITSIRMSQRRRFSREGFTADVLGGAISKSLLNPALLIPAILLARSTEQGRDFTALHPKLLWWTQAFAGLSIARLFNGWLNRRALNNGVKDKYDWTKEIVLVTGGADGIGKRIVQMFADKGVKVVVLDVQPMTYEKSEFHLTLNQTLSTQLLTEAKASNVNFFSCDITSTNALQSTASEIRTSVGDPTILINNAGVCRGKPILSNTDSDLNLTFNVNTLSHYKITRDFMPSIIKNNHGMIVTVASIAGLITAPHMTDYAASKAAAVSFHEGLTAELVTEYDAPRVRTVLVAQGHVHTRLFEGYKTGDWVVPSLHVDTVAEAVVGQVLSGNSGVVVRPRSLDWVGWPTRFWPWWLQHRARIGYRTLMKDWRGRQVEQLSSSS